MLARWTAEHVPFSIRSVNRLIALQSLVLARVLTTGDRRRRRRMEERAVALYFCCDERRNLPDMRSSSMIFMNVHVKRAPDRHLLGQHWDERSIAGSDESG